MSQEVALFFLRPWLGAGSTTFTAHLYRAFEAVGWRPTIYRIADFETPGVQAFGAYGALRLQCVNMPTALRLVRDQPAVITAMAKSPHLKADVIQRLAAAGALPVVHDSNEVVVHGNDLKGKCVCVRQATLDLVPLGRWIPHPYQRVAAGRHDVKRVGACSLARVAETKRTGLILEANRAGARIDILGMDDPGYAKWLRQTYPELPAGRRPFAFTFDAPIDALAAYEFNVDMTYFDADGGGTQYAELEAMDAGVVNVMHADWFRFDGDMKVGVHAVAVADVEQLVAAISAAADPRIVENGDALLAEHGAALVGAAYQDILRRAA